MLFILIEDAANEIAAHHVRASVDSLILLVKLAASRAQNSLCHTAPVLAQTPFHEHPTRDCQIPDGYFSPHVRS